MLSVMETINCAYICWMVNGGVEFHHGSKWDTHSRMDGWMDDRVLDILYYQKRDDLIEVNK
jgi:hypothetical protein